MDYPRYAIDISDAFDYYEFISIGKKGVVLKGIAFHQDNKRPLLYHCVLGDVMEDGSLNTLVITDNGDIEKVFSTVVESNMLFLSQYRDCQVIIKGSTNARTRFYRMANNANFGILIDDFDIFGVFEAEEIKENFEKGTNKDYDSFLVRKKN